MKLQNRENLLVLGGFLGVVALLAAFSLAVVSQMTAKPIAKAREEIRQNVFHRLNLPDFDRTGDGVEYGGCTFFPVFKCDQSCGFVGQGSGRGYGGEIDVLVGFDHTGRITGVQVLRHKETPGLGANVCERKFQKTIFNLGEKVPEIPANACLDQFSGKRAGDAGTWKIKKDGGDYVYLTGATVTSKAVVEAVNNISRAFADWQMQK